MWTFLGLYDKINYTQVVTGNNTLYISHDELWSNTTTQYNLAAAVYYFLPIVKASHGIGDFHTPAKLRHLTARARLYPTKIVVPTRVAILHESARHNRHKAIDDVLHRGKAKELD